MTQSTPNTQGASWEEIVDDYFEGRTNFVNASEYMKGLMRSIASKERAEGERRGAERAVEFLTHAGTLHVPEDTWLIRRSLMDQARTLPADSTEK